MFKILKPNFKTVLKRMSSSLSSNQPVILEKINHVGLITLNRPTQLNALTLEMVKLMQNQLTDCDRDDNIRLILVKGSGDKAFCAGGDVKSIRDAKINNQPEKGMEFFREEYILDNEIANLRKPYVALLNGFTMGGGVGISVHGKYRVATEKTMFAMPETAIGFIADVGGSYFLPRLRDNLGLYLALTGNRLKGQDVKKTGLATHFVSMQNLPKLEQEFYNAQDLNPKMVDNILNKFNEVSHSELYDTTKIKQIFESDSVENIIERLEKENSEWSKQQLKILSKMSPTSLKVSIKQLELGAKKKLNECLEMEYQLCLRFYAKNDFSEGVRALLVDKDNKPKWTPDSLDQVTQQDVDWYFNPLPGDDKLILPTYSKL
jgi:3-hydroxyisobutyryl-CoA hydrolase